MLTLRYSVLFKSWIIRGDFIQSFFGKSHHAVESREAGVNFIRDFSKQ